MIEILKIRGAQTKQGVPKANKGFRFASASATKSVVIDQICADLQNFLEICIVFGV